METVIELSQIDSALSVGDLVAAIVGRCAEMAVDEVESGADDDQDDAQRDDEGGHATAPRRGGL